MIHYQPKKILLSIGIVDIYSYGFALFLAFTAGFFLTMAEVKRKGLDVDHFIKMSFFILLGAIFGTKLWSVSEHFDYYFLHPSAIFDIRKGGASSYGGFFGGFISAFLYIKKHKIDFWRYADEFVPGICMGIFLARIGCFLNWDDYGIASNLPWAINAGDFPRHPTQIYLAMNGLILFFIFFRLRNKETFPGNRFLSFLVSYNLMRLFIEFFRDVERYYFNLTSAQLLGIVTVCAALLCLSIRNPTYD